MVYVGQQLVVQINDYLLVGEKEWSVPKALQVARQKLNHFKFSCYKIQLTSRFLLRSTSYPIGDPVVRCALLVLPT